MEYKKEFFVICDNIRSLENIGSIFRTADALGVAKIYLCGICGTPPNEKIAKTALGAENSVPWEYYKQTGRLIDKLKKDKVNVVALEQSKGSVGLRDFKPTFPMALIVGNEVRGVSKSALKRCNRIVEIEMLGKKESLNVSVAFGIAGYEIVKSKQ
jgi:tRNA G18 (ribose-2'-O)-methylase SpoU